MFSRSINLPEPISLIPDIIELFEKLTKARCIHFKHNNKGTRTLYFNIYQVDYIKQLIQIKITKITSSSKIFIKLFELKLSQVKVDFGINFIRVSAHDIEDLPLFQDKLQINNQKKITSFVQHYKKKNIKI